jgi:hypothetical protein
MHSGGGGEKITHACQWILRIVGNVVEERNDDSEDARIGGRKNCKWEQESMHHEDEN